MNKNIVKSLIIGMAFLILLSGTALADHVPPENPKYGGTLVAASYTDPSPILAAITTATATHMMLDNVYDSLIIFQEDVIPMPNLAES